MIQTRPDGPLLTFRVGERIDRPEARSFRAQRLGEHRAAYLTYEGPVSGGRGRVTRVAAGDVQVTRDDAEGLECVGTLGEARGGFRGESRGDGLWEFRFAP